ncbi:MAG TPA: hypothetical protein VFB84_13850 [Micromonosporaceae bacterium]|nr:hypothetical protein [Micromonosporaceae bacterium]
MSTVVGSGRLPEPERLSGRGRLPEAGRAPQAGRPALARVARWLRAEQRTVLAVTGAATFGVWGLALLLSPDRARRELDDRAAAWYQRELALFDIGHAAGVALAMRGSRGDPQRLAESLRTMSVTTLMLAAAHVAELVRPNRRAVGYHTAFAILDLAWALAALRAAGPAGAPAPERTRPTATVRET